ncbi:MAG: hypothetical protein ACK5B6_14110, partial [Bacteroidia bacterium]
MNNKKKRFMFVLKNYFMNPFWFADKVYDGGSALNQTGNYETFTDAEGTVWVEIPIDLKGIATRSHLDAKTGVTTISENGYFGRAFVDEQTGRVVIAHRGTDELIDWADPNIKLGLQNVGLTLNSDQFDSADKFTDAVREFTQTNYPGIDFSYTHTGHSLGGAIAQMQHARQIAADGHASNSSAYSYDGPGVSSFIKDRFGEDVLFEARNNSVAILSPANLINSVDEHSEGTVIRINDPDNHKPPANSDDQVAQNNEIPIHDYMDRKMIGMMNFAAKTDYVVGLDGHTRSYISKFLSEDGLPRPEVSIAEKTDDPFFVLPDNESVFGNKYTFGAPEEPVETDSNRFNLSNTSLKSDFEAVDTPVEPATNEPFKVLSDDELGALEPMQQAKYLVELQQEVINGNEAIINEINAVGATEQPQAVDTPVEPSTQESFKVLSDDELGALEPMQQAKYLVELQQEVINGNEAIINEINTGVATEQLQ